MNNQLISGFDNMKIHEKLRALRDARGISQAYMAGKLNIDTANYGRMERGEAKLTVDRLQQILEILETPVEQFFGASEGKKLPEETEQHTKLMQELLSEMVALKNVLTSKKP